MCQKRTIVKKMTKRDFLNLLYLFENNPHVNGEDVDITNIPDLSSCNQKILSEVGKQSFRLTEQQKIIFDRYFKEKTCPFTFSDMISKFGLSYTPSRVSTPALTPTLTPALTPAPVQTSTDGKVTILDYLYDKNAEVDATNFNAAQCLNDVVTGKITDKDVCNMLDGKYHALMNMPPSVFKDMTKSFLQDNTDFASCLLDATHKALQLQNYLEMPEPSLEETIDRFIDYLRRYAKKPIQTFDGVDFADAIRILDDRIQFFDEEGDLGEIVYTNKKDMINDVLYYGLRFRHDMEETFTIFDKQYSLRSVVKDYYKKYPNGFDANFFKSAKEAYEMGKLEL